MTVIVPEQREFFQRYPLPWGAATKIAKATGYAASTISSWTTGHTRMPKAGLELVLEELHRTGAIPLADDVEVLRLIATDHQPKRLKKLAKEVTPAVAVEVESFEQVEWLVRHVPLSDFQRLQLVRVLLT